MSLESALEPDDFGAGFYQGCWQIICDDLLNVVQEFFEGMLQPRGFMSMSIVLISKVPGVSNWKKY